VITCVKCERRGRHSEEIINLPTHDMLRLHACIIYVIQFHCVPVKLLWQDAKDMC